MPEAFQRTLAAEVPPHLSKYGTAQRPNVGSLTRRNHPINQAKQMPPGQGA